MLMHFAQHQPARHSAVCCKMKARCWGSFERPRSAARKRTNESARTRCPSANPFPSPAMPRRNKLQATGVRNTGGLRVPTALSARTHLAMVRPLARFASGWPGSQTQRPGDLGGRGALDRHTHTPARGGGGGHGDWKRGGSSPCHAFGCVGATTGELR